MIISGEIMSDDCIQRQIYLLVADESLQCVILMKLSDCDLSGIGNGLLRLASFDRWRQVASRRILRSAHGTRAMLWETGFDTCSETHWGPVSKCEIGDDQFL